ncbi:MAG: zinc ribbon domain-containing protein [Pyrinomonadaceae bacterium]|nr:zinc ribbon domain-containing protein [Pyrinomonadaceae bacterium]
MFCPKCAAQNLDGASYCRVCGANISLVPQALSGQLPPADGEDLSCSDKRALKRREKEASLGNAFRNAFMGVAFLLVSMALAFSAMGRGWWFWMLIPAFSLMGTGVAQYIKVKEDEKRAMIGRVPVQHFQPVMQPPPRVNSLPRRNTGELVAPPPSVTEGTTRHLGGEAPTRHLDASTEQPK